jgi:hypothetical protein
MPNPLVQLFSFFDKNFRKSIVFRKKYVWSEPENIYERSAVPPFSGTETQEEAELDRGVPLEPLIPPAVILSGPPDAGNKKSVDSFLYGSA